MLKATNSSFDTEIFRYNVGVLEVTPPVYPYDIRLANSEFDVVFAKARGWVDPSGEVDALDHLYEMETTVGSFDRRSRVTSLRQVSVEHLTIARTAFQDSRFLLDRRLHERAPELYVRWMLGKTVHVLDGAEADAFLLEKEDAGVNRISLVAVSSRQRGTGLGRLLVSGVLRIYPGRTWRVKVSCRNYRAIRFYESLGFKVKEAHTAFHIWT